MSAELQNPFNSSITNAFDFVQKPEVLRIILLVILAYLAFLIIRNLIRAAIFLVKTFLEILGKTIGLFRIDIKEKDPLQSDDWLTRAQAKQEIRFQNSLPPLLPKQVPQKKKRRFPWQKEPGKDWYPTGWTLNKETGLWEPPDYIK